MKNVRELSSLTFLLQFIELNNSIDYPLLTVNKTSTGYHTVMIYLSLPVILMLGLRNKIVKNKNKNRARKNEKER